MSTTTIRRWLAAAGIRVPRPSRKIDIDTNWLRARWSDGSNVKAIAAERNCSPTTIATAAKRLGLPFRPYPPPKAVPGGLDGDWLRYRRAEGLSDREISELTGVSTATVNRARHFHNIE